MDQQISDHDKLSNEFWQAMEMSPILMLSLKSRHDSAVPMTVQLDRNGKHHIWFFTTRQSHFAQLGDAIAYFASKNHSVFARFNGTLTEETSRECIDAHWSNMVAAWYPDGRDDPQLLMLRMALGDAAIWVSGELGFIGAAKMFLGMD